MKMEKKMRTVNEVSLLTGVSIRTLQYYDKIGLLHPTGHTESGYRLYDDSALEVLQQILLFRELAFPLKEIKEIISSPNFNCEKAIKQQIELLTLKKEHLESLIDLAREIQFSGGNTMDFNAFDTSKIDEYTARAKEQWGQTSAYQEYEKKANKRTPEEEKIISKNFMQLFEEFGKMKELDPASVEVQGQVKKLQEFISHHYYHCTDEILLNLSQMYSAGNEFTENIDRAGGEGTATFTAKAILIYCGN